MLKEYSSDLLIHEQLTLKNPLQFPIWKVYPVVYFQFPIWIYVNSDIALFCQTPYLRSMMAKAWYQQQLPIADTDPCWSQHSFQIWWKDWSVITYQPLCRPCHFIYMKLMEEIGQSRLCYGIWFFFFFVFSQGKRCDKKSLKLRGIRTECQSCLSPLEQVPRWLYQDYQLHCGEPEIAGTHHEIMCWSLGN